MENNNTNNVNGKKQHARTHIPVDGYQIEELRAQDLDNLIKMISCMNENNYFADFNNTVEHLRNSDDFRYKKDPIYSSNNDFIKMACSQLDNPKFPFSRSPKFWVNLPVFEATLMLIELNFYFYSDMDVKSNHDLVKLVFDSDIICYLALFASIFIFVYDFPCG